jgi:histidyl-tRNA synthetase
MYQGNWKKFGNQLKYADRRGCPIAIIQGSDERAAGKVQIKDLIEGRKQAEAIADNEEYRESPPGQVEIAEGAISRPSPQASAFTPYSLTISNQNTGWG